MRPSPRAGPNRDPVPSPAMNPESPRLPSALVLLAAAVFLMACVPALNTPFFTDDIIYLVDNLALQSAPLSAPWQFFTGATNRWEYLPVRDLSYALDLALFGLQPLVFRLHNLLLYVLCGVACWLAARALAGETAPARPPAVLASYATAIFLAHPAHLESVIWISGRKDLLAGLFSLLTVWAFTLSLPPTPRRGARAFSVATLVLAVLSKSAALAVAGALPLVVLLRCRQETPWPARLGRAASLCWPHVLVAAAALAAHLGMAADTDILADDPAQVHRRHGEGLPSSLLIAGHLLRIAVLPVNLRLIYDLQAAGWEQWLSWLLIAACILALPLLALAVWRRRHLAAGGLLLFLVLALPYLQLVPFHTWSLVSERFLFLPLFGMSLAAAALLTRRPRPWTPALAAGLIALLLAGSLARAAEWREPALLWAGNARLAPAEHRVVEPHIDNLLAAGRFPEAAEAARGIRSAAFRQTLTGYVEAHRLVAAGERQQAALQVQQVIAGLQWNPDVFHLKLAELAVKAGAPQQAVALYRHYISRHPSHSGPHYNLGLALRKAGDLEAAAEAMEAALDLGLTRADAANNLGLVRRDLGQMEEAEAAFRQSLAVDPSHWHGGYNLGRLLLSQNRLPEARQALQEAQRRARKQGDSSQPVDELLNSME